jgi:hypothetical protein
MPNGGGIQTFQNSADALRYLQTAYGSANYREWQAIRRQFWSYQQYLSAGAPNFTFFGNTPGSGGLTLRDTNMPKAGSFGQVHFLLKAIRTRIYIEQRNLLAWTGLNNTTLHSDFIAGFVQAGELEFFINSRIFLQLPKPFLYAPPGGGEEWLRDRGVQSLTLTAGAPNTLNTTVSAGPHSTQLNKEDSVFLLDPNILIEAEQNFQVTINFPSGVIPVIATVIVNDSTNPLKIGVELDGIMFRPVQ